MRIIFYDSDLKLLVGYCAASVLCKADSTCVRRVSILMGSEKISGLLCVDEYCFKYSASSLV